jgi:glycosyltransferase involved in cell wall biosynthesis
MIPTYNRPDYLRKTLASVLAQVDNPEDFQIEVIDNFSDEHFAIADLVQSVGKGMVKYYRQSSVVPFQRNWNTCIEHAKGKWVHILHDDDLVLSGFYTEYGNYLKSHPNVGLVFSHVSLINEVGNFIGFYNKPVPKTKNGILTDALSTLITDNIICSTSVVVPKAVYNRLMGFNEKIAQTIDWEEWLRISVNYPVGYIHSSTPLIAYRIRTHGLPADTEMSERIDNRYLDILYIIDTYLPYIPDENKNSCYRRFMKTFAFDAFAQVKILVKKLKFYPATLHLRWCIVFLYKWILL